MTENRLNWGCAHDTFTGWIGSDLIDYGQKAAGGHVGDIIDGLPWPDGHFDVVVANHSLQMITYNDIPGVLTEFHRVLKPGGRLRVLVPDVVAAFRAYERGAHGWFPIADDVQPTLGGKLSAYLTWYSSARSCFTVEYLAWVMRGAGFERLMRPEMGETRLGHDTDCEIDKATSGTRFHETLIMEGLR